MPKINCAIYTRKSTEHGLDMEFNSLQNQEESCKAYILSQAFNGWEHHKTYSDGDLKRKFIGVLSSKIEFNINKKFSKE